MLIVPFPESSLNDDAGKLFMRSYAEYARRAAMMTSLHASPWGGGGGTSKWLLEANSIGSCSSSRLKDHADADGDSDVKESAAPTKRLFGGSHAAAAGAGSSSGSASSSSLSNVTGTKAHAKDATLSSKDVAKENKKKALRRL